MPLAMEGALYIPSDTPPSIASGKDLPGQQPGRLVQKPARNDAQACNQSS